MLKGWIALIWVLTLGSVLALFGAVAWLRRPSRGKTLLKTVDPASPDTPTWITERGFDLDRYLPMQRLYSEEDLRFLQQMPGYRPEIGVRWKRERRRLFRLFLDQLSDDFEYLHANARAMVAISPTAESAPLVKVLVLQKVTFWRVTTTVRMNLALDGLGVGSLDARPLLQLVENMRFDLDRFAAPQTSA